MEHKIILSADSTFDLGDELRQRYHVQYYPFHIILDRKAYSDGVDLVPDQIYQTVGYFRGRRRKRDISDAPDPDCGCLDKRSYCAENI